MSKKSGKYPYFQKESPDLPIKQRPTLLPNRISDGAGFDIQSYVPFLLNQSQIAILPRFTSALGPHDLSLAGWRILAVLHKHHALRVRELLSRTAVEPPTLSRNLAILQKRRLIVRSQSEDDARGILVKPTPAGLAIAEALIPHAITVENSALKDFTADEKIFLINLLKRIQANIEE